MVTEQMVKHIWKLSHYYTVDEQNTTGSFTTSFSHLFPYLGYLKLKLALDESAKVPKSFVRGLVGKVAKLVFRPWSILVRSARKNNRFQMNVLLLRM